MTLFSDQLNRTIEIKQPPERIVSLVPSQTELLYDLGLRGEVAGITKFCVHPQEWHRTKQRIGGTKNLDIEKIRSLEPDLIIGNIEENEKNQIEQLMKEFPVWMSDIKNLADAKEMISCISDLVNKKERGEEINHLIDERFSNLQSNLLKNSRQVSVAYLIWNNPLMSVGQDTFINNMLGHCGFINVFNSKYRYPEISMDELKNSKPELILLSSEPFPFKEQHIENFKRMCPASKVILVDGEMFSWYGSRLVYSPDYFYSLID